MDFDWDDANIDHIAAHGVSPSEAEDAILDPDRIGAPARSSPTEKRRGIVGTTEQGRILFVSYTRLLKKAQQGVGATTTAASQSASVKAVKQHWSCCRLALVVVPTVPC